MVLFDRQGNFLGPISEVTGEYSTQRYVIRIQEDSLGLMKRKFLKTGDYVYYYNCDRIHLEQENINRELNLIEMKRQNRSLGGKKPNNIKNQIINSVICNLKDLRLDSNSKMIEEAFEEDQKSTSRNSKTIINMVMKTHCNQTVVGSAKERQKRRKYKKAKARMFLNKISEGPDEDLTVLNQANNEIEDELLLGKRCLFNSTNPYKKEKTDSITNRSTEYSRKSTDTDKKLQLDEHFIFKTISMNQENMPPVLSFGVPSTIHNHIEDDSKGTKPDNPAQ